MCLLFLFSLSRAFSLSLALAFFSFSSVFVCIVTIHIELGSTKFVEKTFIYANRSQRASLSLSLCVCVCVCVSEAHLCGCQGSVLALGEEGVVVIRGNLLTGPVEPTILAPFLHMCIWMCVSV